MKSIKLALSLTALLVCFSCVQNKNQQQTSQDEFDSIYQDTTVGFGNLQEVVYRFPTPGEMFGVIKEGGLVYNSELLSAKSNAEKYLNSKAQTLNLGIYIADFAYIALFGRQNEAVDYLEIIEDLSEKINISDAINEELTKRIKSNLGNVDSMINFSDEAFLEMFSYCEDNQMHHLNALISAGAYIEGLFIALNNVDKYSSDNALLAQLAEQKYSFEHLLTYAKEYQDDKNVKEIVADLEKINAVFSSLEVEKKSSRVSSEEAKLVIGGGKVYKFTKPLYKDLKDSVNKLRNKIINLS